MARIFWIGSLGFSVLLFVGLALTGVVLQIRDREFNLEAIFGIVGCLALAVRTFQVLVERIIRLPEIDPSHAPKPEDFYDDKKGF